MPGQVLELLYFLYSPCLHTHSPLPLLSHITPQEEEFHLDSVMNQTIWKKSNRKNIDTDICLFLSSVFLQSSLVLNLVHLGQVMLYHLHKGSTSHIQPFWIKASEQYFPVMLFIMLHKVILAFESVGEILKCNHSNESYWAVLCSGDVCYAVQSGSSFWVCGLNPKVWPFKWNLLSRPVQLSATVHCSVQCLSVWNLRVSITLTQSWIPSW